jgi:excisionase family DNA binding protein
MSALQQEIRDAMEPLLAEIAEIKALLHEQVSADVETKLITVRDAAARLGCGEETVRRMVKSGKLKCKRIGNQIRLDPADLF